MRSWCIHVHHGMGETNPLALFPCHSQILSHSCGENSVVEDKKQGKPNHLTTVFAARDSNVVRDLAMFETLSFVPRPRPPLSCCCVHFLVQSQAELKESAQDSDGVRLVQPR